MKNKNMLKFLLLFLSFVQYSLATDFDNSELVEISNILRYPGSEARLAMGRTRLERAALNEADLIAMVKNEEMRRSHPEVVGAAITILGEMKSTNAIPYLFPLLMYNEQTGMDYRETDWSTKGKGKGKANPIAYIFNNCPVRPALANIGPRVIEPLLEEIAQGSWKEEDFAPKHEWVIGEKNYAHYLTYVLCSQLSRDNSNEVQKILNDFQSRLPATNKAEFEVFLNFMKQEEERRRNSNPGPTTPPGPAINTATSSTKPAIP